MFKWLNRLFARKARRRNQLLVQPFPEAWLQLIQRRTAFYRHLKADQQRLLRDMVRIFIAEKQFVGCNGIQITEPMQVIVAAEACRLLLGISHLDVFPRLKEIIVYPHDFTEKTDAIGPDGRSYPIHRTRAGEAWRRGPVILAWNSVMNSIASPHDGYNVIIHEFAHVIDMQDGGADGIPPLLTKTEYERWTKVFFEEFNSFVLADRRGTERFIDPYGASSPSEFFAVASEHFFEQPDLLQRIHPRLYELFRDFYHQDPAVVTRAVFA